jgi:hypothetical protein
MDQEIVLMRERVSELHRRLDRFEVSKRLYNQDEWKLINELLELESEFASRALRFVDPNKKIDIVKLQLVAATYDNIMQMMKNLKILADEAFEVLKEQGKLYPFGGDNGENQEIS